MVEPFAAGMLLLAAGIVVVAIICIVAELARRAWQWCIRDRRNTAPSGGEGS